jgi:hypothetical protein
MFLFAIACAFFWQNLQMGFDSAQGTQRATGAVERDLLSGMPPSILAERHVGLLMPYEGGQELVTVWLGNLRRAGVGKFRLMREEPTVREISLPVRPIAQNHFTWENGTGKGSGKDSFLVFGWDAPQFVYAIRLKYSYGETPSAPATFRAFWRESSRNEFTEAERSVRLQLRKGVQQPSVPVFLADTQVKTLTLWVNDTINQFRLHPDDQPVVFEILEIVLLVPEAEE